MTDKTISTREADFLRERIAFVVRDGGYRVVCTDSESPDGILPRCTSPAHPEDDRDRQWDVLDCCQTEDGYRLIEAGHEHIASVWVDSLYVIPSLLDERDALRARVAELEAERRAKGYTDWLAGLLERHANEKSAQQPERFADECDCECQPGQPCLRPERDCYCGPCPVCGENPQRRERDTDLDEHRPFTMDDYREQLGGSRRRPRIGEEQR